MRRQRWELVSPYTKLEIKINHHWLPGPPSESSNTNLTVETFVLMQMQGWFCSPNAGSHSAQDTRVRSCVLRSAIPQRGQGTTRWHCNVISPWAMGEFGFSPQETGEGADKGNCCPPSTAGETSTQQKAEQALIDNLSHVNFSWLKAPVSLGRSGVGACVQPCAHSTAMPRQQHTLRATAAFLRVTELPRWAHYSYFPIFIQHNFIPFTHFYSVMRLKNIYKLINSFKMFN